MTSFLSEDSASAIPEYTEADVQAARAFAVERHAGQTYGDKSYVEGHLDVVAALAREYGLPLAFVVGAYLHDLFEDTATSREEIVARFGQYQADLVDSVSGEGETRREQRASILEKLHRNRAHVPLKLMDRMANVLAALEEGNVGYLRMYRSEMPDYAALFRIAHPRAFERLAKALDW